jgi:hypothetical protein
MVNGLLTGKDDDGCMPNVDGCSYFVIPSEAQSRDLLFPLLVEIRGRACHLSGFAVTGPRPIRRTKLEKMKRLDADLIGRRLRLQ